MIGQSCTFGRLVRQRRQARGMSQRALARAAGVTPAYISLIEQGRRRPERAVVERLAQALAGTPVEAGALVASAGYVADAARPAWASAASGALARVEELLDNAGLPVEQRITIESLVLVYATGLTARAKEGRPLVADLAAPWQARVLEAMQEKMAEDFEHFRDAYVNRVFEL